METRLRWLIQRIEEGLTLTYQAGGVTPVAPPYDTGWRSLPATVTAFVLGYKFLFYQRDLPAVEVHPGEALCVPPDRPHRILLTGRKAGISRWSHIAFHIFGGIDLFSFLERPGIICGAPAKRMGEINEALSILHAPKEALTLTAAVRRKALALELLAILMEGAVMREDRLPTGDILERFSSVLERMADEPSRPLTVEEMARACSLSVSRFHSAFKSVMGVSPGRYLQDRRLQHARQLLLTGDLPVKVVAAEAGFRDAFHFSRLFRKRCGLSPSDYRAQIRAAPSF